MTFINWEETASTLFRMALWILALMAMVYGRLDEAICWTGLIIAANLKVKTK